jgi:outer membrane protein assembly factor BamB
MLSLLLVPLLLLSRSDAADWPQFLGPARDGVAAESEPALLDEWTEPQQLWQVPVGEGHAGPVVVGGLVLLHDRQGDEERVQALSVKDGSAVWKKTWPATYKDSFGMDNGPRAVPAVAAEKVYVHGADGMLRCLKQESGELVWEVDSVREYESHQGYFGRACAPLVAEGIVIFTPGGKHGVVALDAATGKQVWAAAEGDEASYASPVLCGPGQLLCWLRNHLTLISLVDGKVLAREHYRPEIDASVSAATPVRVPAGWLLSAEYDVGCSVWQVQGGLQRVWQEDSLLNAHYATPVASGELVFGFDGRQESGMTLRAIQTTKPLKLWESPRVRGGTLLRVNDKLLVLTEEGELWLVRATAEKFDLLGSAQILRAGHRSYAAYSDGIYYARDATQLVALRLRR